MANNNLPQLKAALNAPSVKAKFNEMLGKRSSQFMTSITSVVQNNSLLQKADVNSIIMGSAIAASMDLPLNPNLGYAALVPFNSKDGCFAQLQVMTKGWVELFLRSGQCQSIINEVVYDGQLVKKNRFTGEYLFDEDSKKSDNVIGVMAYFRLMNGYEKYEYMTIEEVKAHAQKFSQTYRKGAGIWKEHFLEMSKKTVLKKLITKWAPKSIEMQQVALFDQSIVKGDVANLDSAVPDFNENASGDEPGEKTYTDFEDIKEEDERDVKEPANVNKETGEIKQPELQKAVEKDELEF